MIDPMQTLLSLVSTPAPPGEEEPLAELLARIVRELKFTPERDPKGNLLVVVRGARAERAGVPGILVTAHLDEIALMVTRIEPDGKVRVAPLGGAYTWKWGEGPVDILTRSGAVTGILSYGCIHTSAEESVVEFARRHPLNWERTYLFTGLSADSLREAGVRPGLRVVLSPARRQISRFGSCVASYFLDDRVDLLVWLLALETIAASGSDDFGVVTFAATTSEEVGGEGAQYLLRTRPADICVALEIGPKTPEADFPIDAQPTIWVRDGYAAMEARDGDLLADCCAEQGLQPHWQYLSRGGSDASCAAAKGLTARPVTLGIPVENSHGYEIMHVEAPDSLRRLLLAYLRHATAV